MMIAAHHLSWQLLRAVLSIYFVITLLVTLTQMGVEYSHTRKTIENELSSVEKTFSPALRTALWELNFEQLEALHRGIIDLPILSSMRVVDASGRELINDPSPGSQRGQIVHAFKLFNHFSGEDVFLAEVSFQTEGNVVFDRLRLGYQMIVISALIKSTVLTLLFLWAFRRLLGAPLRKLTEAVTEIDLDSLGRQHSLDLHQSQANELTKLEEAFNRMLQRLERERIAHFSTLEELNRRLEQQVVERTHELRLANQQLEKLVRTDPLTGAANHRHFVEQAEIEVRRAKRNNTPLSLLMMDLDHFKRINDTWGHAAGDEVLRNFVSSIKEPSRATDLLARLGGEEFVLLLPDTGRDGATEVALRILDIVRQQKIQTDEGEIHYHVSIGVGSLDPQETCYEPMLKRADEALYYAKESGRDRMVAAS